MPGCAYWKANADSIPSSAVSALMRAPAQRFSSSSLSAGMCFRLPVRKSVSISCAGRTGLWSS